MFELVRRRPRNQAMLSSRPYDCWRDHDGGVALEFHRTDDGFYLRFPDRADFSVDLAARRVELHPAPDEEELAAADLFNNQVAPLLSAYDGKLVLHASAVAVDGAVIGFMGGTGRGKSTLAAAFASRGYAFLTDDGLALEPAPPGYIAHASADSVRLFPDSRAALLGGEPVATDDDDYRKVRFCDPVGLPHRAGSAPLKAMFALGEPEAAGLRLERLGSAGSLDALLKHSFMLDVTDKSRMRGHFRQIASLAECVPCLALDYPRDFAQLDTVVGAIVDYARSL